MMTFLGTILRLLSIVVFIAAWVGLFAPARAGLSSRWQSVPIWVISVILLGISGSMLPDDPDSTTSTPEDQTWVVHDYRIIKSEPNYNRVGRPRRYISVLAPTAVTREDRLATLAQATSQVYREYYPDVILAFLIPFGEFSFGEFSAFRNPVATLHYVPDGCGIGGDDCTGEIWTNVSASDAQFTTEQIEIAEAWETHRGDFLEADGLPNEARLKEFLAQKFDVTLDHLSDQTGHFSSAYHLRKESMELPDALINRFAMTREDEDARDDAREEIEERHRGFHCLSSWDGNHRGMTELIKAKLNDPDSMETRETRIALVNSKVQHRIIVNFTARNAFGGVVRSRAFGLVDNETCEATITSIE